MAKNIRIKLFLLVVVLLCCLLAGCNESSSGSDKAKSADVETTWYRDADGDGYGDPSATLTQPAQPAGYVASAGDCADYDGEVYPGAPELCDGKDNNCDGNTDENACGPDLQILSGRIANLSQAEAYLRNDSYLQLVFYPAGGQMPFTTDGQGRRTYTSDLASVDIPDDGVFSFETTGLSAGNYVVAAQLLAPYGAGSGKVPILSDGNDQPAIFSVPADNGQPIDTDLGNVSLPVPAAVNALQNGLAAPSGVSATDGVYEDRIRVTWSVSAGASSYEVFRAESFSGQKTKVAATAATFYDDMALPCGADYYYWIKAVNASQASELFYSDLGFVRCPLPDPPAVEDVDDGEEAAQDTEEIIEEPTEKTFTLSAPTGTQASDGTFPDKIRISWNPVSSATYYDIYRCDNCCGICGTKNKIGSSTTPTYDDFNVGIGTYSYWIKANNLSETSEFGFPDNGYIMVRPFAPTNVTASDGTYYSKILVKWDKAPKAKFYYDGPCCPRISDMTPIVSSYEVYRAHLYGDSKILIGTTTTNQFYDTEVECSTCCTDAYVYWVKAVNAAGKSNFSNDDLGSVYRTLCDPTPSASDGRWNCVWVSWDHVPGAKYYEVYRSDSADGEKIMICRIDRVCDIYEYRDITTTCPRVYYYWIKAYDAKGYTSCTFGDYDTGYCELK